MKLEQWKYPGIIFIIIIVIFFWKKTTEPFDEIQYDTNLKLFDECMKKTGIFYWVGEGTALGFIREGNFIKDDTDIDVGLYYKDKALYYEKCLPLLLEKGFTIKRGNNSYTDDEPHSIILNDCYIDVDFMGIDKPSMTYQWPKSPNELIQLLEPFQKINVNGIEYNVPSIKYIEYLYGEDWKTPKNEFKPNHYMKRFMIYTSKDLQHVFL